jgi:putative ABC transport system substrate-binding protein
MRRRQFISLLGGAAASPLRARAQQTDRVWRIGVLVGEAWPEVEGLHDGLRDLGYREGENLLIQYRFANGDAGRFLS